METSDPQDPRLGWHLLPLASTALKVELRDGRWSIRCAVRGKWVLLEPEEWVRQHLIQALRELGWPLSRMVLEHPVRFGGVDGRVDVACFDRLGKVALALEVKAHNVPLNQKVADQVARYDLALGCPWLMISNGLKSAVWRRDGEGICRPHSGWPKPEGAAPASPVE